MSNGYGNILYVGVTNDIHKRVLEHKNGIGSRFTRTYKCTKLVYYEEYADIVTAIAREKSLKNWKSKWKHELVTSNNPNRNDLAEGWY